MSDTWVPPELAREGITPRELDVLLDVSLPLGKRRLPPPGESLVYDNAYTRAHARGFTRVKRLVEGLSSLGDTYDLAAPGKIILARYSAAARAVAGKR